MNFVFWVPDVQQVDVVHQDAVRRDDSTCGTNSHRVGTNQHGSSKSRAAQTCSNAAIGQVRRDGDPPALIHTHAQETPVHPGDESAQAHLADEGFASVMAAEARR